MFCPKCRTEYRKGFTICSDCDIPLADELPPITSEQLKDLEQRHATRKSRSRFAASIIFAPLFAPLMMFLILVLHAEWIERFTIKSTGWLSSFGIIMIFGALVSYAFTVILGLPLYFIFKRLGRINYWSLSIGSTAIASVPWLLMGLSEGIQKIQENYAVILVLAACGFAVGNAFYIINNWRNPNMNAREGR